MEILLKMKGTFLSLQVWEILCLIFAAFCLYRVFTFLKNNNALILVWLFLILLIGVGVYLICFDYDGRIAWGVVGVFLLAVCLLFPVEIKRILWSRKIVEIKYHEQKITDKQIERSTGEIIRAVQNLSKQNTGAIIILSSGIIPKSITESGTVINSDISSRLIESIFFPNTPLHDGAMIVKGAKISSAGCFLPLSQEVNLPQELGTRHRAAIGITETIDVVVIIVSEETGIISIAEKGKLRRYIDNDGLRIVLDDYYKNLADKTKEANQ